MGEVHRGDNDTTMDLSEEMKNEGKEKTKKMKEGRIIIGVSEKLKELYY